MRSIGLLMSNKNTAPTHRMALVANLVSAYISYNRLPVSEIPALIKSVHDRLDELARPAAPGRLVSPVPIKQTVTRDYIVSLEDGRQYKSLKRHLATRGFTPEEYRRKWGLPLDYPMIAANYSAQRSEVAKTIGLGGNRRKRFV